MDSRELAKQILSASEDMDYLDYTEAYETEVEALAKEIDRAKEYGLVYILSALQQLTN